MDKAASQARCRSIKRKTLDKFLSEKLDEMSAERGYPRQAEEKQEDDKQEKPETEPEERKYGGVFDDRTPR